MKEYHAEDIRNFAIVGHASSGKTMLSEAMLVCGEVISRMGSIDKGTTASDYHENEKKRQISIRSSLLQMEWQGKKLNMIDAPGYVDFVGESLGALRVADFALIVIHAGNGVGVGTHQAWQYATEYDIPKVIVLNGFDREKTDFDALLAEVREQFGNNVFPMDIPANPGPGYNRNMDVLRQELITYDTEQTGKYQESSGSGELQEKVEELHKELIENVAESDDSLLEKFFEEGELTEEEMRGGLHSAIQNQAFIPLFCTSAENNIGVTRLLDFIAKYGSSPLDRKKVTAVDKKGDEIEVSIDDSETVAFIFKTMSEEHLGELSYFRVYSGDVHSGLELHNADRNINERVGQIYQLNGKERTQVKTLFAGDIGGVVKLKDTHTNNTLCHAKKVLKLPKIQYPEANINEALKTLVNGQEEKISVGMATLHEEDPTFIYRMDNELNQIVLSGQGELHLIEVMEALKNRFKVDVALIEPRIPYRETIHASGEAKYRHKKQSGGAGQFAEVWMRIEPKERGSGVEFTESLVGQNVDRVFVPSVEKGVMAACKEGILAGCTVVDLKVDFYDGKQHPVDSKDIAFQIAGKHAFRDSFMNASPCLLEPIYHIEVKVPEAYVGDVFGDISSRRGKILGSEMVRGVQIIKAEVPQAELYRYATKLRSMTAGEGIHSERMDHYEELPKSLEKDVIEAHKTEK